MTNQSDNNQKLKSLEKDVSRIKDEIRRLDIYMMDQEQNLEDLVNTTKNIRDMDIIDLEEYHDTIRESKKEIITFTFELISIIVGLLSLLLAITILWINRSGINTTTVNVYVALGLAFIVLFGIFVYSWIKKNFPKIDGANYKKIISYIDSNNSQMVDYIHSNNSDMRGYIDSNNSKMIKYIQSNNTNMVKYIDSKISELNKYIKERNKTK